MMTTPIPSVASQVLSAGETIQVTGGTARSLPVTRWYYFVSNITQDSNGQSLLVAIQQLLNNSLAGVSWTVSHANVGGLWRVRISHNSGSTQTVTMTASLAAALGFSSASFSIAANATITASYPSIWWWTADMPISRTGPELFDPAYTIGILLSGGASQRSSDGTPAYIQNGEQMVAEYEFFGIQGYHKIWPTTGHTNEDFLTWWASGPARGRRFLVFRDMVTTGVSRFVECSPQEKMRGSVPIQQTTPSSQIYWNVTLFCDVLRGDVTSAVSTTDCPCNLSFQNIAALDGYNSSALNTGALCWVQSVGDFFALKNPSSLTTTATTVRNATGVSGGQWVRLGAQNAVWQARTAWTIDPTNSTGLASDENSGADSTSPLLTFREHAFRLSSAVITQNVAVTVLGSQQSGDDPSYTYWCRGDSSFVTVTFTGTPTTIYTGTIGSYSSIDTSSASTGDNHFSDASIAGGSFTAAGALAKGIMIKRTNGTAIYCWALKDLGSTSLRVSTPVSTASLITGQTFSGGDTYVIQQLPQLLSFRRLSGASLDTKFVTMDLRLSGMFGQDAVWSDRCYVSSSPTWRGSLYQNCCLDTGSASLQAGPLQSLTACAFKGSGTTRYTFNPGAWGFQSGTAVPCAQGCSFLFSQAATVMDHVAIYDCTSSNSGITCDFGGRATMLGFIHGSGNTGKMVAAGRASQIMWVVSPVINASLTSDGSPYLAGGTASASPIALTSAMNGCFQTE